MLCHIVFLLIRVHYKELVTNVLLWLADVRKVWVSTGSATVDSAQTSGVWQGDNIKHSSQEWRGVTSVPCASKKCRCHKGVCSGCLSWNSPAAFVPLLYFSVQIYHYPLLCSTPRPSNVDCLEDKKDDGQKCSVLYCVLQLCRSTLIWIYIKWFQNFRALGSCSTSSFKNHFLLFLIHLVSYYLRTGWHFVSSSKTDGSLPAFL